MAKKKFLNLDNMNILWDNIDRNFLRREDIPYTEFEELLTESNTIIGAINELYRLIGEGISPVNPSIVCSTSSITENYQAITKTVTATYKDYLKINEPQVTGGDGWLTVTQSGSGSAMTYSIALSENNGSERIGTIVLSCTGKNGNAQHTITVTQNGIGDATIQVDNLPSTLSDHTAFSRSGYYVSYSNWSSINEPTSDSSWLTITEVSGNVNKCEYQISVTENTGSQRSAILTFSCVGRNGKPISITYTITQPEASTATITFSPNPINVAWDAEEATVQVTYSNYKEILTPTEGLAWVDAIEEVNHSGNAYTYRISGITKNPSNTSRTGKLKFGCKNLLDSPIYSEVSLEQANAPAATLIVTPTSETIAAAGGDITFTVTFSDSEYYWVEKDASIDWVSIPSTSDSISGGSTSNSYTVTIDANTGASRSTHLVFKCHGHDSQDQSVKVTITQEAYSDAPEVDTLPMYIGYIPYETLTANGLYDASGYSNLTEDIINLGVTNSEIAQSDAKAVTTNYTGFGDVPAKSFLVIALPQSSGLTATKWNEVQQDCPFSVEPLSNGENTISIDGNTYQLYGEFTLYSLIKDSKEIYYKIK